MIKRNYFLHTSYTDIENNTTYSWRIIKFYSWFSSPTEALEYGLNKVSQDLRISKYNLSVVSFNRI